MADLMDRPCLSETSPAPGDSQTVSWMRSGGDIIKEYLGEKNLLPDARGGSPEGPPSGTQKADANSLRSDHDIIREYLGERNIFSDSPQATPEASLHGAQATGRPAGAGPARQPFSDSSWLDKFLDERDKELDLVLEASDNEDEFAVSLEGSWDAEDSSRPALVPKTHLIARPASMAAEELVARHKRNLEVHCGVDYNDWTNVALQPTKAERQPEADGRVGSAGEHVGSAAPGGGLSVEEILTDDFDSSSACSSDYSEEACAQPSSWARFGSFEGATECGQASSLGASQKTTEGLLERFPRNRGPNPSARLKGTLERAVLTEERATGSGIFSGQGVLGLVRSASADRELYSEVVRAAERGATQERERMDAVLSATVAGNQAGATRMCWSLAFANPQLEEAYRRSHIANGGDADYLCAVLRIWFSLLHLYMLARQFSILKEIRWGWIAITAPGRPLLSTSLEWNIIGLILMFAFLYMHLCQRSWWNKNRLVLLSLYLGTVWALEVWYTLASRDAPVYRLVRLGSPAFFMSFMYNVPFLLHMRFRSVLLAAQLAALTARQDVALCPWVVLFHVLSSAVAYLLDRRSRRAFVQTLPPCLLNLASERRDILPGGCGQRSSSGKVGEPKRSDMRSMGDGFGSGGPARRGPGGALAEDRRQGVGLAASLGGGSGESTGFEERFREQLRQRRLSLGGFAGGFAGVGCVKSGQIAFGTRLAHAETSKDSQGEQVA